MLEVSLRVDFLKVLVADSANEAHTLYLNCIHIPIREQYTYSYT